MHEYGLMEDVVNVALEACRRRQGLEPVRVRVQVGEFALASPESLETAYEILTQGTALQGVELELVPVSGRASCEVCAFAGSGTDLGLEPADSHAILLCPRCGSPLVVTSGAGVVLAEVQLQDHGSPGLAIPAQGGR